MTRTRRLAALIVVALAIAACGDSDDDGGAATDDTAAATTAAPAATEAPGTTAAPADAAADAVVTTGETELGTVLTDASGLTLYLFTQDSAGSSVCVDDCAAAWPPVVVDGDVTVGEGLDAAAFGTITRDDGVVQLTINDKPLYTFASDAAAGDVNGQGVNDVWFAVGADGQPVGARVVAPGY
jgi:predicted lipoprotein with Yx(FWY)xxD motif